MAHFKAKLTQQSFPFNFAELAGTVLVGNALEQNLQTQDTGQEVPQAYFMQNVLPTQRGFASVHYTRVAAEHTYPKYVDKLFVLYDVDGNLALYSTAGGACLVYSKDTGTWTSFPLPDGTIITDTTVAYLKGTTYIHIAGAGLFYYDFQLATLVEATVTGITVTATFGVCAANQYLILWDDNTVYWSSPADPLDFTIVQGLGGSSSILSNRSRILQCLPTTDGFIAYTTRSAIYAPYTGNAYFPFNFREIASSAGVAENEHVAYDSPNERHIAWTTSGFQLVTGKGAQLLWPELSDAIGNGLYSAGGSDGYPYIVQANRLTVKVSSIGARYIAISLKRNASQINYSHAYVYDIALERWGRLDIPHVDFFEYRAPEFVAALTYEQLVGSYEALTVSYAQLLAQLTDKTGQFGTTFGCVNAQGAIYVALSSSAANVVNLESPSSGATVPNILLGRYRLQRQSAVTFQQLQLSSNNTTGFNVRIIAHDASGRVLRKLTPTPSTRYGAQLYARLTGAHISLQLSGKLNLTSVEAELTTAGNTVLPAIVPDTVGLYTVVVNSEPVVVDDVYVEVTP